MYDLSVAAFLRFLYFYSAEAPLLSFAASCVYSPLRGAIALLFLVPLLGPRGRNWTRETGPINSANPAISEIINKNPNEAKSALIEAFLCGRCRAITPPVMHDSIGSVSRIACQSALNLDRFRNEGFHEAREFLANLHAYIVRHRSWLIAPR